MQLLKVNPTLRLGMNIMQKMSGNEELSRPATNLEAASIASDNLKSVDKKTENR